MIQAHEIKVGNRFIRELHNSRGLEYDHDFILTEEWMGKLFGDNTSIALQDLNPIPLSKEVLLACGWIWNEECKSYEKYPNGDARMHLQERGNGSYTMFNYVLRAMIADKIFYLHELQNLYYALTKTELNYHPK